MALKKDIVQPNRVTLSYHRVARVDITTNVVNSIEVNSYINADARNDEKEYFASDDRGDMNVLVEAAFYEVPYDQTMTVDSAYAYLKTLDEFAGAEDC